MTPDGEPLQFGDDELLTCQLLHHLRNEPTERFVLNKLLVKLGVVLEQRIDDAHPAPSADFASTMGSLAEAHTDLWKWQGWTAGIVREILSRQARAVSVEPQELLATCLWPQTEWERQLRVLQ